MQLVLVPYLNAHWLIPFLDFRLHCLRTDVISLTRLIVEYTNVRPLEVKHCHLYSMQLKQFHAFLVHPRCQFSIIPFDSFRLPENRVKVRRGIRKIIANNFIGIRDDGVLSTMVPGVSRLAIRYMMVKSVHKIYQLEMMLHLSLFPHAQHRSPFNDENIN